MSRFDQQFARSAVPAFASQFGDSATYTPPAGSASEAAVTLSHVIFGPEKREKRMEGDMETVFVVTREASVMCDASHPNYCGVANPQRRGTITRGSTQYAVETVTQSDATGMKILKMVNYELSSATREGYHRGLSSP